MGLEYELKYLDVNFDDLGSRLNEVGGQFLGRYFETNLVFDYADRSLKEAGILLRLREKQGKAVLTVKKPPKTEAPSSLKVFEEIESEVDDFHTVKSALETVGFHIAFAYEKVREKWIYRNCAICMDSVPFGDFVEIEGLEGGVQKCAQDLGLDGNPTSKMTYHALNLEYREKNNLPLDESFVFEEGRKEALIKELGKE